MEQQFPKIGGPENRAQKSFQNWTYLLAERKEVFSLFYMLGSQIMTPKWAQNWDPKNGFKTAPATHSCKFHGVKATTKAHTHTHTDTHLQDRRTRIAKLRTHRPPPQEILLQLNTTAVVAGVLSLWTKMEQQFPKIGGPENRAQKSFQNWTYLLAERKEVFSLFYMLGSQIMTPKWAQNWDPKNGFKTAPATHSCKFHGAKATTKAHTHTHTDTHLQDRRTRIAKLVRQKLFADLKFKNPLWGARRALPEIHGCRHPQFWSPNLLHFGLLETALREPTPNHQPS